VDEMVKQSGLKDDVRAVISNAEVLTMGYLAVSDFNGNYRKAHQYFNASRWFKAIDYSRFIRRLNVLQKVIEEIFSSLSALFSRVNPMQIYAIDSFPVELCQIQREKRSNLMNDPKLKGYNASKKRYFYGFKVHMITTSDKEPVQCFISMGREADVTIAYDLIPQLPKGSIGIGDKGYVSKELETISAEHGVHFKPIYRQNQEIEDREYFTKRKLRKKIETAFSMITAKFGKVIKATSINGFLTKLKLFIAAYSIDCFFKLPEHKQNLLFAN
jgi:hypothetical protein